MGQRALSASLVAKLFSDNIVEIIGIIGKIILDWHPSFTASFWWELWALFGTKLLMNSAL